MAKEIEGMPDWEDERNASVATAMNTPNLSKKDVQLLLEDAKMRSLESGHVFEYTDKMKEKLYGDYYSSEQPGDNEKKIVPHFGEQSRRRDGANRDSHNSMPRMWRTSGGRSKFAQSLRAMSMRLCTQGGIAGNIANYFPKACSRDPVKEENGSFGFDPLIPRVRPVRSDWQRM